MIKEFNEEEFEKTFQAIVDEHNVGGKAIENVIVHLPKSWAKEQVDIQGVPFDFKTDTTIEIEVKWEPNFTALVMKAPWF